MTLTTFDRFPFAIRAALASTVGALALGAWAAPERPAALQALENKDVTLIGTLFDADGKQAGRGPLSATAWKQLESSRWIQDGKAGAPRIVYVFTDPNCPYCNKFWADARPWVDSGKVVLRHVMVGMLTPTSPGKAAALLAAGDPAAALAAYEAANAQRTRQALASGRPRPLADETLQPLRDMPPAIQAQLAGNEKLMAALGVQATPAMVWRDASGAMQVRTGAPDAELPTILGAR